MMKMKVETLWKGSGSGDGLLKTFKANLKGALNELKAVGFLSDWRIEGNLVYVVRAEKKT
ncbi:hypothetical protein [Nitrosococcus wardiae]|uniref:hypothetical protein n=1 Tax=Nitrosococcus wardiae TaxID=1814290 RepID=UPI001F0D1C6B|nr:hypothetical protein [Nitrosococcus wardiae]